MTTTNSTSAQLKGRRIKHYTKIVILVMNVVSALGVIGLVTNH